MDDHRAAVRYDLLHHGYRLEWVGTRRLPWGDAFAIITMQPPAESAVYRELHPEDYDRTREVQLLEIMAVMLQTGNIQRGNPSGAKKADFPRQFEDLLDRKKTPKRSESDYLAGIAAMEKMLKPE